MRAFVIENAVDGEAGRKAVGVLKTGEAVPVPKAGEALVRVLRAGICNTDLELLAGYMGFTGIVGHEFVGVVEKIEFFENDDEGARCAASALLGKRVVGEINLACTRCRVCVGGGDRARNHCPERTVLGILGKHGTYAEYLTLPCRNLHVVPDNVSDAAAVFAEPLAAACRIVEQGLVPPDANAAVLGDGKLGLLVAEVLARRATAAAANSTAAPTASGEKDAGTAGTTTLIGRHKEKMDMCCGSAVTAAAGEGGDGGTCSSAGAPPPLIRLDAQEDRAKLAGTFDVVVDATGSPHGLAAASELCRPLGTVVLKSTCAAGAGFNPAPVVINEQRIVGSRCGPFEAALRLLAEPGGGIDVERYVSGVYPLEEAAAALECARQKGALKPLPSPIRKAAGRHLTPRMVYLESSVAAAFTLGSAGCLLNLAFPHQQQQQPGSQLVFVSCLLVICVLSTFALWSVEGRHACWHHHGCAAGKEVAREPPAEAAPRSCADVLIADSKAGGGGDDDDDLPSEEFPLERRSSFVEVALRIHG
eukprot:g8729.t2